MANMIKLQTIPALLCAIRAALALDQKQLANRLGIAPATLSRWESAKSTPRKSTRAAIAALAAEAGITTTTTPPAANPAHAPKRPSRRTGGAHSTATRPTERTIKLLFAKSGNQCAHPDCSTCLVMERTEQSGEQVMGEICHIHARQPSGPRWHSDITREKRNSLDNLVLLCPTHHTLIDKQPETYTAETLRRWKYDHEKRMQMSIAISPELVDQKIDEKLKILRKQRGFPEFDRIPPILKFANSLIDGDLCAGSNDKRSRALAWCARLLAVTEQKDKAESFLQQAKLLGTGDEIQIASAFIASRKGDKLSALKILMTIDTLASRSASFMIITHHENVKTSLEWLKTAGFDVSDLEPYSKAFLLTQQMKREHWEDAAQIVCTLDDSDFAEVPILHQIVAHVFLAQSVPAEFRNMVFNGIPFDAAGFPLASNIAGMQARKNAYHHFSKGREIAEKFNLIETAHHNREYALWLELRDSQTSNRAKEKLQKGLQDQKFALRYVPLGLAFGIKLDPIRIEQEIERQKALNGGITSDAARARFALACMQGTPEKTTFYIEQHHEDVSKHIDKKFLLLHQIEACLALGFIDKAKKYLQILVDNGLPETEQERIRIAISEAEGTDLIEQQKQHFWKTNELIDLKILVDELYKKNRWEDLCEYAQIFFARTQSVPAAELFSNALNNTYKFDQLITFLEKYINLFPQSENLQMLYAWALYHEGEFLHSRTTLEQLNNEPNDRNYRELQLGLAIALGDQASLLAWVEQEFTHKEQRSAQELVPAARLAIDIAAPHAKDLLFAAVEKDKNNAHILAASYYLACRAGWEDEPDIRQWPHRAAELSGPEGPIRQVTTTEFLQRKLDWQRREASIRQIWQKLNRAEIPIYLAAEALNTSLVNLMLLPALTNPNEMDSHLRNLIPTFSEQRQPMILVSLKTVVGFDVTTLLSLNLLGILETVLDAFDSVYIPHATLGWLLHEKQRVSFHQPSQVTEAREIRDLFATDVLQLLVPSAIADENLSNHIGHNLALLIAEAEKSSENMHIQSLVVHPAPIHTISSLMQQEADLTAHTKVLSNCMPIVEKLHQQGQITAQEKKKIHSYLQLQEQPWPQQPEITDGAILFLNDLSTRHFLHLDLLTKLKTAGFTIIVAPEVREGADRLLAYDQIANKAIDALENIRNAISTRLESQKIKFGKQLIPSDTNSHYPRKASLYVHPTFGIFKLAHHCNIIFSDDRFLNQNLTILDNTSESKLFTTLDILETLAASGFISFDQKLEYRTRLRQAGYLFIPVTKNELMHCFTSLTIQNERIVETAELKAIRENFLHIRMEGLLHLSMEETWFTTTMNGFIQSIRRIWMENAHNHDRIIAISNWIVDLIDIRDWMHKLKQETQDNSTNTTSAGIWIYIRTLISPLPDDTPPVTKEVHHKWLKKKILQPISEQFPDLPAQMVNWWNE